MYQRLRNAKKRRALNRRRRRMHLLLHQLNQNMRRLQMLQTTTALLLFAVARVVNPRLDREFWIIPRPGVGWFEVILQDERQSRYWKEHFRMHKPTFLRLVEMVEPEIYKRNTVFRDAISPAKRVAIALWRLAGGASFRTIAAHFDVGKSSCVTITKEFCKALNRFAGNYIKFPTNRDETARAIALFQDECKIPQALGAIDGTHIEIIAPDEPFDYFDRHHRYSVTMQAVVGENLMFLDTAIGYPGSMHDARILRASNIFTKAENGSVLKEPVISLNGVTVRPLLLGDGAYPLLPWLLKPYPINVILNRSQRNYNKTLSSARSSVERAFGILKARWRILLKRLDNKFCNIPEVILTCCILHNFCQDAGEEFDDDEVLQRIIAVEREEMQANAQVQNRGIVQNPVAQTIRQSIEQYLR